MCFQVQAQDWVQVTSLPNVFNETHHSFAFSFDDMGYIVVVIRIPEYEMIFISTTLQPTLGQSLPLFPAELVVLRLVIFGMGKHTLDLEMMAHHD